MNKYNDVSNLIMESFNNLHDKLIQKLPNLISAILLIAIGWLIALIFRIIIKKIISLIDKSIKSYSLKRGFEQKSFSGTTMNVFVNIIYWIVIVFFFMEAAEVLGIKEFSVWINKVINYFPILLSGLVILLAGVYLSRIAKDITVTTLASKLEQYKLIGNIAKWSILITSIIISADQIGIDVTFLMIIAGIITATILGGIALAFSLGSKIIISNFIGAFYFKQNYQLGQVVKIADQQGKIIEITQTSIIIETSNGRTILPGKIIHESPTVLVEGNNTNE